MQSLIAVVGSTGTGKSDLALELAQRMSGEIVNADAFQLYRGMNIGTAKVPLLERRGIPHHLLDVLDIAQDASLAWYQSAAREAIDTITQNSTAFLVGGSGLYVRAATDELDLPGTDPAVRERLETEFAAADDDAIRARLRAVDPVSAERLGDRRRLIRALEVHEITGRPFASFMPERQYIRPTIALGIDLPPQLLEERLRRRVRTMVDEGLVGEVEALLAAGLRESSTAGRAIGYPQFVDVVDGRATVDEAIEATVVATRRLAKKQRTWFRGDPRIHWFSAVDDAGEIRPLQALADEALTHITPTP